MSTPNKRAVVYLPPDLQRWLEKEAAHRHESVGAVIRRAVRKLMEPLDGYEFDSERGELKRHANSH